MSRSKKQKDYDPSLDANIEFSDRFVPKYGTKHEAVSLTGYKRGIYLEITRSGCCPRSAERLDIPLYDADFDKLIGMLRRAKKAAQKVQPKRGKR